MLFEAIYFNTFFLTKVMYQMKYLSNHSCTFIFSPSISTVLIMKSTPIVAPWPGGKSPWKRELEDRFNVNLSTSHAEEGKIWNFKSYKIKTQCINNITDVCTQKDPILSFSSITNILSSPFLSKYLSFTSAFPLLFPPKFIHVIFWG